MSRYAAALLFFAAAMCAQAATVRVDRLRWPSNSSTDAVWTDSPDYPEWVAEGVPVRRRATTYISRVWEPPAGKAKSVVLIVGGQQVSPSDGESCCGTGSAEHYKSHWASPDSQEMPLVAESVAAQLAAGEIGAEALQPETTFLALVYDAQFEWDESSTNKNRTLRAYAAWLARHVDAEALERIVLLGDSRGGALVTRLARELRLTGGGNWETAQMLLGLVDAVPNPTQHEIATSLARGNTCRNPLDSHLWAHKSDLVGFFAGVKVMPLVRHVVTGSPFIIARAFCVDETPETIGWYNQSWATLTHIEICRCQWDLGQPYSKELLEAGWGVVRDWMISQLH